MICVQEGASTSSRPRSSGASYRVAPDLYRGELGIEAEEAEHLMTNLDFPGAVQSVQGAVDHLHRLRPRRRDGLLHALRRVVGPRRGLDCADFYGICPDGLADPSNAGRCGHRSTRWPASARGAAALEEKLRASGVAHGVHVYPGVGHAFMNDTPEGIERKAQVGQGGHDQAVVDLAGRTKQWLTKHLTELVTQSLRRGGAGRRRLERRRLERPDRASETGASEAASETRASEASAGP